MNTASVIRIGIIGLGIVGSGVLEILAKNKDTFLKRYGIVFEVILGCVRTKRSYAHLGLTDDRVICDYHEVIHRKDIDIIIELTGDAERARSIILESLKCNKHVVTANKASLAKYGKEIFLVSAQSKHLVFCEASVGSIIPILKGLYDGLSSVHIDQILGILNGTTNYILSQMFERDLPLSAVVKEAQKLGFAEADPTSDIFGYDSLYKLIILCAIGFGEWISIDDVFCSGVENINLKDIKFAHHFFGYGLKLLGIAKRSGSGLDIRVQPVFLPRSHPLLSVNNEYNAIIIQNAMIGDVMFSGKGAGKFPAASAVVSDIIAISRHLVHNGSQGLSYSFLNENKDTSKILDIRSVRSSYYIRFLTLDKVGTIAQITNILSQYNVSIISIHQPEVTTEEYQNIVLVTHEVCYGDVSDAVKEINVKKVSMESVFIAIEKQDL